MSIRAVYFSYAVLSSTLWNHPKQYSCVQRMRCMFIHASSCLLPSGQQHFVNLLHTQVDTIFITHLHGDHCFGIGSMLISMCKAKRAALEQQQQPDNQQQHQQLSDLDQGPDKLRIVGPPKLAELVTALLVGAGVGRKLDMPVYITELVDDER